MIVRVGVIFSLVLACCAGVADDEKHPVEVSASKIWEYSPFLYSEKGFGLGLGWKRKGEKFQHLKLPLPRCGFGVEQTYRLDKMEKPVEIKNIPCPLDGIPVRFTFMADTQEGVSTDAEFGKLVERFDSDAVIYGGDLIQTGSFDRDWQKFFEAMEPVNSHRMMIPVVGNHEYRYGNESRENWTEKFNFEMEDGYYSVWLGPVHVIVLNSSFADDPSLVEREQVWLENELQLEADWKVVTFHHPPFSRSIMQTPAYFKKEYVVLRRTFVPLFEKYGVNLVLNGHTHIYEHSFRSGVHYVTTGAAGGMMGHIATANPFEVVPAQEIRTIIQIEASREILRATAVKIDGTTVDDLVLGKGTKGTRFNFR